MSLNVPATDAQLSIEKLTVIFGTQTVLQEIDLSVRKGETVAIIGESGCGKTVLLKSIVHLVTPTSGRVRFDGQTMGELGEQSLTRQRLRFGFVFQNAALFDSLNVYENVAFALREQGGHSDSDIRDIVRDRLHEVGLSTDIVAKKPAQLSGGMRKRVGLARALATNPEVMLYDEPTTGLDPIMSDIVNELIIATREHHDVTSVVVTHDMKSARKIADRIVMLYPRSRLAPEESQMLFEGPAEAIDDAKDPRVVQFIHGEAGERLMEMASRGAPTPVRPKARRRDVS